MQGTADRQARGLQTPAMIRFGEMTEDEVFVTADAARPASKSKTAATAIRWSSCAFRPGDISAVPSGAAASPFE